jgi:hypothetical protein
VVAARKGHRRIAQIATPAIERLVTPGDYRTLIAEIKVESFEPGLNV